MVSYGYSDMAVQLKTYSPESIQKLYLTLLTANTLAASFIWGINTIFLLNAGLSNTEAFAAMLFLPSVRYYSKFPQESSQIPWVVGPHIYLAL